MSNWTNEEENFLVENINIKSFKEIAQQLNKTASAVQQKWHQLQKQLNYKKKKRIVDEEYKFWTLEKLELLRELHSQKINKEIAKILGTNLAMVACGVALLGLCKTKKKTLKKVLSPEEEQLLKEIYPCASQEEILRAFPNHSWRQIIDLCSRRNIKRDLSLIHTRRERQERWRQEENIKLKQLYETKAIEEVESEIIGRTWSAIKTQANKLKLQRGSKIYYENPENRNRLRNYIVENPDCYQFRSRGELELLRWIQQFYPNSHHYRKKIDNKVHEVDIYIPELQLGIEYNGLHFHCEERRGRNYHLQKTKAFESLGIRLVHIWEHEWEKRDLAVKSFLLSAIDKNQFKIGARKCNLTWSIEKEDIKEAQDFLEKYHIQGKTNKVKAVAKVFYQQELVAVATFGKHHRGTGEWVLSRFCTKMNYTIQGVLSRISKLAVGNLNSKIISWADYRLSQGNGYIQAGWQKVLLHKPDYFYFKSNLNIISKQSRQKKAVKTPEQMTESEHAKLDGLRRVYDCGKIKFEYTIHN